MTSSSGRRLPPTSHCRGPPLTVNCGSKPLKLPLRFSRKISVFSNQDPHWQVLLRGTKTVLATTSTRGFPVPETLASTPINVTGLALGKITRDQMPQYLWYSQRACPQGGKVHPPSPQYPLPSSFGGVVTPVNVPVLYQALSNHPEREFVHKLCSELREGARIGVSGPRCPRFSNNLPTTFLNPEVFTAKFN